MKKKRIIARYPIGQLRTEERDGAHYVTGYAALFNVISEEIWPGVREKLAPGAFTDALKTSDVRANINHDSNLVLGRTSSGTLKLTEDELGLFFEVQLPDTTYARDLGELMRRGDVRENSFAFSVLPENIAVERVDEHNSIETVHKIERLYDVSIVAFPAYPQTFSVYRDLLAALETDPLNPEGRAARGGEAQQEAEAGAREATLQAARLASADTTLRLRERSF